MQQIAIILDDPTKVLERYKLLPSQLDDAVKLGVQFVSAEFYKEVKGKDGLMRWGRHDPGTLTPSEPGTPPAAITTTLLNSIFTQPVNRVGFGTYEQTTLAGAPYARAQELGDDTRGLPPRPFMKPAADRLNADRRAERYFMARIKQVIKYGK